jgi:DNA gyrase subunit A
MGRNASGVRGIRLASDSDEVVGMICINDPEISILVVSEKGYGKRSKLDDYRVTNRGGKGVKTLNVTEKTGYLIAIKDVTDSDDLMIINKSGIIIRIAVENLRIMGRATQGVRLINLRDQDEIAAVAKVSVEEVEEIEEETTDDQMLDNQEDISKENREIDPENN